MRIRLHPWPGQFRKSRNRDDRPLARPRPGRCGTRARGAVLGRQMRRLAGGDARSGLRCDGQSLVALSGDCHRACSPGRASIRPAALSASATSCRTCLRCCCPIRNLPARPDPCAQPRTSSRKATCCIGGTRQAGAACARAVRTTCCGCLMSRARYVEATGDTACSRSACRSSTPPNCAKDEHDRYAEFPAGTRGEPLSNIACARSIAPGAYGTHGLPLIGEGDWNDGMNRVGAGGKGESVWLGWFMARRSRAFARACAADWASRHSRSAG